jgi:uncharacterized protein (DUF342 family)
MLAYINLAVSKDRMGAFLTIEPPPDGNFRVTRDEIMSLLAQKRISYGIKDSVIGEIASKPVYNREYQVAEGLAPKPGTDGRLEYAFEYSDDVAPVVLPSGQIDYKNMNLIHEASEGEVLCRVFKPTPGADGFSVYGDKLPAKPGKPVNPPRGRNVRLSDAGDAVMATISGQVKRSASSIDVLQEFEVKKDVDYSTGNITFVGNVTVRGNVLSGFSVSCGGDVTIYGLVEKASITAAGDIVLHGGMTGQGSGSLRAGGNIFAKYVENSIITASGKITAECIMHSAVRAGVGIELIGRKGLLVGGSAKAREYVKAITIGSQFATQTEIDVGSDPRVVDRIKEIKNEVLRLQAESKKTAQALAMLAKLENAGALSPEKQLLYARTLKISSEYDAKLEQLKEEHDGLEAQAAGSGRGVVSASGTVFVGVRVAIGNASMLLKEDLKYCSLKSDGSDIRVGPY